MKTGVRSAEDMEGRAAFVVAALDAGSVLLLAKTAEDAEPGLVDLVGQRQKVRKSWGAFDSPGKKKRCRDCDGRGDVVWACGGDDGCMGGLKARWKMLWSRVESCGGCR